MSDKQTTSKANWNIVFSISANYIRMIRYSDIFDIAIFLAAYYFTTVWSGTIANLKNLAMHAMNAANRLFGIPDYRHYALADGIKAI